MQLAAWQTARRRSYQATLAPYRIFIKTLAALGWSTPELGRWLRVAGAGRRGIKAVHRYLLVRGPNVNVNVQG
eukprot:6568108-Pyramimonas_sp.AAC.1